MFIPCGREYSSRDLSTHLANEMIESITLIHTIERKGNNFNSHAPVSSVSLL